MPLQTCRVSCSDVNGVEHTVEVTADTLGSSFARVRAGSGEGAPTLAIVGHIDEIGVAVTNIEDSGLLSFTTIGGISPEALHGQRLVLLTRNGGRLPGAFSRKRVPPDLLRERPRLELSDLHIDIGARSREEAESLVRVGDAGVWIGPPVELPMATSPSREELRLGLHR